MEKNNELIAIYDLMIILFSIAAGTIARIAVLRADSRQTPSVPNGYFIHMVNGFIAASLGAVFIPALLYKEYAAVTFLVLAIQHFREIRKQEFESLESLEKNGYMPRGKTYIDGISKTFEARNYIALLTSLGTSLAIRLTHPQNIMMMAFVTIIAGTVLSCLMIYLTKGKRIGDICDVYEAKFKLDGATLYVEDIYVTSMLGTVQAQTSFLNEGVAFVVKPKSPKHRLTIENEGQRNAMLFDAVRSYGVKRYQFTRRSFPDGRVVIAFVPMIPNCEGIAEIIRKTPVLESIRKRGN